MYELKHRSPFALAADRRAPRLGYSHAGGWQGSRRRAPCNGVRGRRQVSAAASALDGGTEAATAPVQPLHSAAQLRSATAVLQNAITTAVVDFSRRDDPQASASTQFVIITEEMPLDRAAAEGWLPKLVRRMSAPAQTQSHPARVGALCSPSVCCIVHSVGHRHHRDHSRGCRDPKH